MIEKLFDRKISRRGLLFGAAKVGYVGAVGLYGYQVYNQIFDGVPNNAPSVSDYEGEINNIDNPILRAASVIINTDNGFGHGGLYTLNGEYFLLTEKHVVDGSTKFKFEIPGVGSFPDNPSSFWQTYPLASEGRDNDPNMRFVLQAEARSAVKQAMDSHVIEPLQANALGVPKKGEEFVFPVPEKNKLARITFDAPVDNHMLRFKVQSGYSCFGYSGLPILALREDKSVSPRSVGLMSVLNLDIQLPPFPKIHKDCGSNYILVKPHWSA